MCARSHSASPARGCAGCTAARRVDLASPSLDATTDAMEPKGSKARSSGLGSRIQGQIATAMEVRHARYHRYEGPCLQDPGTGGIVRKKYRGCHSKCRNPRFKDHSRYEVVRSRANERPYRKRIGSPLPGHLASWFYARAVKSGAPRNAKPASRPAAGIPVQGAGMPAALAGFFHVVVSVCGSVTSGAASAKYR